MMLSGQEILAIIAACKKSRVAEFRYLDLVLSFDYKDRKPLVQSRKQPLPEVAPAPIPPQPPEVEPPYHDLDLLMVEDPAAYERAVLDAMQEPN